MSKQPAAPEKGHPNTAFQDEDAWFTQRDNAAWHRYLRNGHTQACTYRLMNIEGAVCDCGGWPGTSFNKSGESQ